MLLIVKCSVLLRIWSRKQSWESMANRVINFIKGAPATLACGLIAFYRAAVSPLLPGSCRFVPTCSEYGLIAFKRFGFRRGFVLTAKRIIRCRPGGPHGYDPVPETVTR